MNKVLNMMTILLIFTLYSCKDTKELAPLYPPESSTSLGVKTSEGQDLPEEIKVPSDETNLTFDVSAIGDEWSLKISDGANWLSIQEKTENDVGIKISQEKRGEERQATITFFLRAYPAVSKVVKIVQEAGEKQETKLPEADLLDVTFNEDGTAQDISPMEFTVSKIQNDHPMTVSFNESLNKNIVQFSPATPASNVEANAGSYYRIDYENNSDFNTRMQESFTVECLMKSDVDYVAATANKSVSGETKFFSSQQGGGWSLFIGSQNQNPPYPLATQPHYGGKYVYTKSDVYPDNKTWYHVVAIHDINNENLILYVNGVKAAKGSITGSYDPPASGSRWIGIGADPGTGGKAESLFKGQVAIARIYGRALDPEDVDNLYEAVEGIDSNQGSNGNASLSVNLPNGEELPQVLKVPSSSSEISLAVDATGEDWEYAIEDSPSWISLKEKKETSISFNVEENTDMANERSVKIVFSLKNDPAKTVEVNITQEVAGGATTSPPIADLLDVQFNSDGSATDKSDMGLAITEISYDHPFTIEYNSVLDRNVVDFNPPTIGGKINANEGSYYRIDYENNTEFKNNISDGASLEVLFKSSNDYTQNSVSGESKVLSSQQSGGGMLLQMTTAGHKPNANSISFNVYTNGDAVKDQGGAQIFVESDVQPNSSDWYHVIGVYDAAQGKSYLYINGEKKNELDTPGFFSFPVSGAQWFGIGADAATSGADGAFGGKIAIARIYSNVLTDADVQALYEEVEEIND